MEQIMIELSFSFDNYFFDYLEDQVRRVLDSNVGSWRSYMQIKVQIDVNKPPKKDVM